ncbi:MULTISPECIES: hypothetical protein [Legionella]|uniref:Dot/Icm secretion system substrate n=1 Tax=Legionella resiliens TaxID=2905958 RepID=A0ABS8X8J1_9GAMM|nr:MULTISPECIES: hypothetical protein [unclassified Legionella]MCE0724765.1 hypothetical protein [Legionella sp. 9fVS26]MCE3533919.1 hypothetical protein [Legionella sp. 8cVS16]QLZ70153.1 hypothetical protein FOLKNPGA_02958 [Legionella sp. PC1000]
MPNPVVYNYTNLTSWQEELTPLELQITESLQFIKTQRQSLRLLQEALSPLSLRISLIQHQIDMNIGLGGYNRTLDTFKLQLELEDLLRRADVLTRTMQPSQHALNEAQANFRELSARQAWLKEHIPAAQSFLNTLQEDPLGAVQTLTRKIWDAFIDYEDTHLTGLSPQVRICLLSGRYLHLLTSYPGGYSSDYVNSFHRSNYLRLCGFLWDVYSKVKHEKRDAEFEKILTSLIESTHVDHHGDLPYPILTGYNATTWFESNKQSAPGCFALKEQDLPNLEEQILNNALAFIAQINRLVQPTALQKHIINAANLIDAEVKLKKQKCEEIDYHFYGRAALILNDALAKPRDKQAARRLGDIAEYASGSTSVGKQVLGGLLIVCGTLLMSASIAVFITTFCSSSVLSAWGFALGLSLFEAELVFGITSSLAAATGIGLTFFAGPTAIESGARKGLSQELMDIKEGIENYGEPPAYSAPVLNY